MSELRQKIEAILINSIDTPRRSKIDSEFILSTLRPKLLDELEFLIKQERIRYGEWLIGKDQVWESAFPDIKAQNELRAELRQRNKGL